MNHIELLIMLRRYRLLYLAVFVAAFFAGGYLMIPRVLTYEGSSTFYLANESVVNPYIFSQKSQQDMLQVSLVQERVYQLAYSTEMMTFLIKQFKLYDHYGIDTTQVNYYAKTVRIITGNIKFNKITTDLSTVIVNDRNNEIAATIANAVVWKLDQLNKKYLIDKIQVNLNFYNSYLQEATRISQEQNQKLLKYMDALIDLRGNYAGKSTPSLSEVEFSIYQATAKIQDMTVQMIMAQSLYSNALSAQKTNKLPSLVVIKKALPEVQSKKIYLVLFATLGGILACAALVLIMYFYASYKKELSIVFGSGIPEPDGIASKGINS